VLLETHDQINRQKKQIALHSVLTSAMPPNNVTGLTTDERRVLHAWVNGRDGR
jgi:uncharacterized membrane protein